MFSQNSGKEKHHDQKLCFSHQFSFISYCASLLSSNIFCILLTTCC